MKKYSILFIITLLPSLVKSSEDSGFVEGIFRYVLEQVAIGNNKYETAATLVAIELTDKPEKVFPDKTLVIPGSVIHNGQTYRVSTIGPRALDKQNYIEKIIVSEGVSYMKSWPFGGIQLKSVFLPSTLESMSPIAFNHCYNLAEIKVDERNPYLDSRDNCNAVIDTQKDELIIGCSTTIIPKGVKRIAGGAFNVCLNLEHVTIPEGVVEIETGAFYKCLNLKTVSLPHSLEALGSFIGCSSLKSIYIPENVSRIETGSFFYGCTSLDTVIVDSRNKTYDSRGNALVETASNKLIAGFRKSRIVEGIQEIGEDAFWGTMVQQIALPKTVTKLHELALVGCKFCTSITVDEANPVFDSRENCNAIIETAANKMVVGCSYTTFPKGVTEIGTHAFRHIRLPESFSIPEGIEKIGEHAFAHTSGLGILVIPKSIKEIGSFAFNHSSVNSVYWNGYVEMINYQTFAGCNNLTMMSLPEGVRVINSNAFWACSDLRYVLFPSSLEYIASDAFEKTPCEEAVKKDKADVIFDRYYKVK